MSRDNKFSQKIETNCLKHKKVQNNKILIVLSFNRWYKFIFY